MFGEVGENFAVDLDVGFLELVDELGVGGAVDASSSVYFNLPERTAGPLFLFSIEILESPSMK